MRGGTGYHSAQENLDPAPLCITWLRQLLFDSVDPLTSELDGHALS